MTDEIKINNEVIDNEEEEVITLTSDDGSEQDFYICATFDMDEKWYIVLEPATPIEGLEEGDVLIYQIDEDENGEEIYLPIQDEKEVERAFKVFIDMLEEDEKDSGEDK